MSLPEAEVPVRLEGGQIRPLHGGAAVQRELEATLTQRLLGALGMGPVRGRKLIAP